MAPPPPPPLAAEEMAKYKVARDDSSVSHKDLTVSQLGRNRQTLYQAAFAAYDRDGSGAMDAAELSAALAESGYKPSEAEVAALLAEVRCWFVIIMRHHEEKKRESPNEEGAEDSKRRIDRDDDASSCPCVAGRGAIPSFAV